MHIIHVTCVAFIKSMSPVVQCVVWRAPLCSNEYGCWFAPRPRHCMRITYKPSAALRLLRSIRISHNKFLRANKWILRFLILIPGLCSIQMVWVYSFSSYLFLLTPHQFSYPLG